MSDEKSAVGVKGVRPNFTPNEVKGYRIRPDQWNWSVVQVKVKGAGSKDAGKEYEDTPMAYTKDLFGAVNYIMRTAGALTGRSYQDEQFKVNGVAADLNALTHGFRDAADISVKAIEELEARIRAAGIQLGTEISEDQKLAVVGLRGELGDVRMNFKKECSLVLESITGVANRAIEFGLGLPEEKNESIRRAANSQEWHDLSQDYTEAYNRAMQSVKDLYAKLEAVGISAKNFQQYLIKAEGGSLEETPNEPEDEVQSQEQEQEQNADDN